MDKESLNFIERDVLESIKKEQPIITRFPPEPNGYLHIGHAKSLSISYNLAKKYGGHMNFRLDDTNPAKEDAKYVDAMVEDIKWLGVTWAQMLFASDYYEQLYDFACNLITKGLAYVDFQTADEISKSRGTLTQPGVESPYRNTTPDENIKLFADMRAGKYADGECVLRAKIDMASGNMVMRDPVMYRIVREKHYRTGNEWCIYPLYDFAHCLSDAIEGISHSCCSLEFENNRILYDWFVEHAYEPKLKTPPRQFEFARLNIEQTVMSKRYLKNLVSEEIVDSWDDPRMPTISGMRRRGYPPTAIMEFVASTGVSRTPMTVPLSALEFYVRTHLDPVATRVSAVFNPIKIIVTNWDGEDDELEISNNPHNESYGKHKIYFGRELYIDGEDFALNPPKGYKRLTVGGTVRLRGAYIIQCVQVVMKGDGSISHLECIFYKNSKSGEDVSGIKPGGTIHYLDAGTAIDVVVNEYMPLLKSGTNLDPENFANPTKIVHNAKVEAYARELKVGQPLQFVRKGFFVLDKTSSPDKLIFNKTISLREGK